MTIHPSPQIATGQLMAKLRAILDAPMIVVPMGRGMMERGAAVVDEIRGDAPDMEDGE